MIVHYSTILALNNKGRILENRTDVVSSSQLFVSEILWDKFSSININLENLSKYSRVNQSVPF